MTAVAVGVLCLLGLGVALLVLWPVLTAERRPAGAVEDGGADAARVALDDEIEQTLRSIKEIAFDRDSGHLSETDFAVLDREERARAIDLMRRREALGGPAVSATTGDKRPPTTAESGPQS